MELQGDVHVSLVNRSHTQNQKIKIKVPAGCIPNVMWKIENQDINGKNTENERENIVPQRINLSKKDLNTTFIIPPCGFALIVYEKIN